MNKLFLLTLFFIAIFAIDDSVFEPGTPENPKENLPYNDDVIVKTLVLLHPFCLLQYMPESCPDMAVDGDELGVHYTVIIMIFVLYLGLLVY